MVKRAKFWTNVRTRDPFEGAEFAAKLERDGWDGAVLFDSQCLIPEVWVFLTLCAQRTSRIMLATGVTNPITRHPSVTAAAAATLQLVTGGRFTLGVGRGDSALAYIGAAPMVMNRFEPYLAMLQTYLRGDTVPLEEASDLVAHAERSFEHVAIGAGPPGSSLTWLSKYDLPKVPLEAMVTGPKAIEAAARVADGVVFGLAAEANRIRWGVETARAAAAAAGRDAEALELGAYVCIVPHPDVNVARELARDTVASMARFSAMNKKVVGPTQGKQKETLSKIAQVYDMNKHGGGGGAQSKVIDAEFIDQFAIVGPPDHCVTRLRELIDAGITRFTLTLPSNVENKDLDLADELLVREVLPALRS